MLKIAKNLAQNCKNECIHWNVHAVFASQCNRTLYHLEVKTAATKQNFFAILSKLVRHIQCESQVLERNN